MTLAELLVQTLAALREAQQRSADLSGERDQYREIMSVALAALHTLMGDYARLRAQHGRLVDEYQHLREAVLRESAA